ncbi:GNAT family N-acetyltransferase [Synechococcus lacustris]|uniref:GNAT family N-acetyltransferase n=1 Tax=Synechococcus lacustris TaxID=2116544 RepID=UPI0020CF1C63|nr:GNAT family N-acetyltransferase [Synechococcus lacustris]
MSARLISHSNLCWRLPLRDLQLLLHSHTSWGRGRSVADLRLMLRESAAVVSLWQNKQLIGFGRASSDRIYRAVLWDVVVTNDHQGLGHGRSIVEALINHRAVVEVERIYLMTTQQKGFYEQLGFVHQVSQDLMLFKRG